jgi:hypothetical protein
MSKQWLVALVLGVALVGSSAVADAGTSAPAKAVSGSSMAGDSPGSGGTVVSTGFVGHTDSECEPSSWYVKGPYDCYCDAKYVANQLYDCGYCTRIVSRGCYYYVYYR